MGYAASMELILSTGIFAIAMVGMSIGVIVSNRRLKGSCGGEEVLGADGNPLSCGACPKKEAEVCPSDDPFVKLAQIAHPNPKKNH